MSLRAEINKLGRDVLTGCDGKTYDSGRLAGAAATAVYLALSVANWDRFDPQAWGIGFGALAAGVGALIGFKAHTEPR
jgi:hypothetical protein